MKINLPELNKFVLDAKVENLNKTINDVKSSSDIEPMLTYFVVELMKKSISSNFDGVNTATRILTAANHIIAADFMEKQHAS